MDRLIGKPNKQDMQKYSPHHLEKSIYTMRSEIRFLLSNVSYTRAKHDSSYPANAYAYTTWALGISRTRNLDALTVSLLYANSKLRFDHADQSPPGYEDPSARYLSELSSSG